EDGIRDRNVTGVQTCALPISRALASARFLPLREDSPMTDHRDTPTPEDRAEANARDLADRGMAVTARAVREAAGVRMAVAAAARSEERRVGKGGRGRGGAADW